MITEHSIRLGLAGDVPEIAAMSRLYIEQGLSWRWTEARVLRALHNPNVNVAVVGAPGALGAFGIMSYADDDAHLLLFAVHVTHRRQGLGSALLRWLEAVARTAGVRRIRLEARRDNAMARCFYNEHGYHEQAIARSLYARSVDGVRLEKYLAGDEGPSSSF